MDTPEVPHPQKQASGSKADMLDVDISPPRGNPFPIVGIGALAGGLQAFGELLAALPKSTGMAFILVEPLDPQLESLLPELLSGGFSKHRLVAVQDGMRVEPDTVYLIPPDTSMELQDGHLHLAAREGATEQTSDHDEIEGGDQGQSFERKVADLRAHLRNVIAEREAHAEELRAVNEELGSRNRELGAFQRLFETAKHGIVVVDVETEVIQDANPYFLELTGYQRQQLINKTFSEASRMLQQPQLAAVIAASRDQEIVRMEELELTTRKGERLSVDIVGNRYSVGSLVALQVNVRDNSSRRMAAKALMESEERFRLFVENVHDYALFQVSSEGFILTWNSGAQRLLGWEEHEIIGRSSALIFVPEDVAQQEHSRELETARISGHAEDERWHLRKDGTRFFASGVVTRLTDENGNLLAFAKIMRDVTARKQQEAQLRQSLEDKSVLVREIHHRVKNNLQVIVSLLSLQANHTRDPEVVAAFEETEGRVRAIAHIHERLYSSDDLTEVEFGAYLTNLARELLALHVLTPDQVQLDLDIADMVLDIEQALPLGLVANELVVNAMKHGLKGGPGRLQVKLAYVGQNGGTHEGEGADLGCGLVQVTDTGGGFPEGFDISRTDSMGFRLIKLLTRQVRGRLEISSTPGASVTVSFPLRSLSASNN